MKKIFTLLALGMMAMAANAAITIYVKCETAPYIWSWNASDGVDYNVGEWPGENKLTETYIHPDSGEEFWTWTFAESVTSISFLFNDGEPAGTKQTGDINSVRTERWFLLSWDDGNGNVSCVDVTEDYSDIEIPDAEVEKVSLAGNHNGWSGDTQWFDVIEEGKKFQLTVNTDEYDIEENLWQFKFRPNAEDWCGYWDVYYDEEPVEGKAPSTDAPEWLKYSSDGNFLIDLEEGTTAKIFTITLTWNGGKEAGKNWNFSIEAEGGETPVKGDVNGDGTVDVADISSIITVMADGTNDAKADVNGDGTVDVADISSVITIMANS